MSKAEKKLEKEKDAILMAELQVDAVELKGLKKKLAKMQGSPERGIETWFRLASKNYCFRFYVWLVPCAFLVIEKLCCRNSYYLFLQQSPFTMRLIS